MHDFDVFNECVTDQQTDQPTDTAYYRDARTHLKIPYKIPGRCTLWIVKRLRYQPTNQLTNLPTNQRTQPMKKVF